MVENLGRGRCRNDGDDTKYGTKLYDRMSVGGGARFVDGLVVCLFVEGWMFEYFLYFSLGVDRVYGSAMFLDGPWVPYAPETALSLVLKEFIVRTTFDWSFCGAS